MRWLALAGAHDQARAGHPLGHGVDVGRPADKGVEGRVLHEDLGRGRGVRGPLEVDLGRVDAGVDEQRHDEVVAGRVLGEHDLLARAVLHPEIVDRADVAARDDAVAAGGPVDLLADHGHGARVLDQLGREQGHHVQRPPQDMALAAGEQVAGLDRVVHDGELQVEAVFLEEKALLVGGQAVVGHDDRRPARARC